MEKINGGYGSVESLIDENITKEAMINVFDFLTLNYYIEGYHFKFIDCISEKYIYKRNGYKHLDNVINHNICPDGGIILLINDNDDNDFHVIVTAEDKYQDSTNGNACERYLKNFDVFERHATYGDDINPYILFFKGSFLNEENEENEFLLSKLRMSLPHNPINGLWDINKKNSSFKNKWNQCYFKRNSFEYNEKI